MSQTPNILTIKGFSLLRISCAVILIGLGWINLEVLQDAQTVYFITAWEYSLFMGIPLIYSGCAILVYQLFPRKIQIHKSPEGYTIPRRFLWIKRSRIIFPYANLQRITVESNPPIWELTVLSVFWYMIGFYLRESLIALRIYHLIGYPLQGKIGLMLLIDTIVIIGLYLLWFIPTARYRFILEDPRQKAAFVVNQITAAEQDQIFQFFGWDPTILQKKTMKGNNIHLLSNYGIGLIVLGVILMILQVENLFAMELMSFLCPLFGLICIAWDQWRRFPSRTVIQNPGTNAITIYGTNSRNFSVEAKWTNSPSSNTFGEKFKGLSLKILPLTILSLILIWIFIDTFNLNADTITLVTLMFGSPLIPIIELVIYLLFVGSVIYMIKIVRPDEKS